MVALLYNDERLACSGTLIAPDVVLTAAHCRPDDDQLIAVIDPPSLTDLTGGNAERIPILQWFSHPQYFPDIGPNLDSMLLLLERPATSPTIVTINLDVTVPPPLQYTSVVGWGYTQLTNRTSISPTLREAELLYITNDECVAVTESNAFTYNDILTPEMLCATRERTGTCSGDSGEKQTTRS